MGNKFFLSDHDVRSAAIQVYLVYLAQERAPSDDNGAKLQNERFGLLAVNIMAGFSKLTSYEGADPVLDTVLGSDARASPINVSGSGC